MPNKHRSRGGAWNWERYYPLLMPLIALCLYFPVLHGGFLWDDDAKVAGHLALRSWRGLYDIWTRPGAAPTYYPLTFSIFWLEYHLWGLHTLGYHGVNILLHGLNGTLVGLALRRLKIRGAWLAALLFVAHPVQLESVAWIIELKNVLSGFFYLLALLAYLRFEERRQAAPYAASLGLYVCALLSKSVACTLPVALLLLAWARGRPLLRELRWLAPFFAIGLGLGLLTVYAEGNWAGALGPEWSLSILERCLIAGRALCFYLGKLAWPSPLIFVYPRWVVDLSDWRQYLYPFLALALLTLLVAARSRVGRWPLAAALFFAGTLFPALGFFNIYCMRFSFVADHFQYLASIGIFALASSAALALFDRLELKGAVRIAVFSLVFLDLALVARAEEAKYRNISELWLDTLAKNPDCALARHGIGILLAQRGRWPEALEQLDLAARLNPRFEETQLALAYVLSRMGHPKEAIEHYYRAEALGVTDSGILKDFGKLLLSEGRKREARLQFRKMALAADGRP